MEKKLIKFIQENESLSFNLFGYDMNKDKNSLKTFSDDKIKYFKEIPSEILKESFWFTEFQTYLLGSFRGRIIGLSEEGDFSPFCEAMELLPYELIRREFFIAVEKKKKYNYEDLIDVTDSIDYEGDFLKYFNIYHEYCKQNNVIIDPNNLYLCARNTNLIVLEKGYYEIDRCFEEYGLYFQLKRWKKLEEKTLLILPDKNSRIQYEKYKMI